MYFWPYLDFIENQIIQKSSLVLGTVTKLKVYLTYALWFSRDLLDVADDKWQQNFLSLFFSKGIDF